MPDSGVGGFTRSAPPRRYKKRDEHDRAITSAYNAGPALLGVGAENPVTSCDVHVLVYQVAEPVSSYGPDGRAGGRGVRPCGRMLITRSVWAVGVVVLDVFLQHCREVAWSGDEEVVEAFPAQGPDPALCDGVGTRCPDRGAEDVDVGAGEDRVEGGGEPAIPVTDQERNWAAYSPRSMSRLRACWVTQARVG
jgi:hypothetical protein